MTRERAWAASVAMALALAVATRWLVAARTLVPARDSEAYLWMAERIAEGRLGAAFETIFHPLYSVLIAAVLALAPDTSPVVAGQLVSCSCAALATIPLMIASRRLCNAAAALFAGILYAVGIWFVRHPADCLSEGPFFLVVAVAMCTIAKGPAGWRGGALVGTWSGLAFGLRPEALAIAIVGAAWFFLRRDRAAALATTLAALVLAAPWMIGWSVAAGELTLTPKAAFNLAQGVGKSGTDPLAHYVTHLAKVPGAMFEAIGYAALPLALYGIWKTGPRLRSPSAFLLAVFALQCFVIPGLRSNIRFLAGFGLVLLPFAGYGIELLRRDLALRPVWQRALLALAIVAGDVVRLPEIRRAERVVLVELGRYLGERLGPDDVLATEMPRLAYFAGRPPLPPRPIAKAEILAQCQRKETRFACVVAERTGVTSADFEPLGFRPLELPERLRLLAVRRGLLVLARAE